MRTAEAVTPKHPDKMCDRISDGILDWCINEDPEARVAIEVMGGHGHVFVTGEITMREGTGYLLPSEIRRIVNEVTGKDLEITANIEAQSTDIKKGVDNGGAGDQGIMVGYACSDNEAMIPQELYLARSLAKFLYEKWPNDGKTQVTLDRDGFITTIVASFQNAKDRDLKDEVLAWLHSIRKPQDGIKIYANPAGDWSIGGFDADTGLTGRKLMVDNYGPQIAVGGGAFSGKDASKVDRSAAYMARKMAVYYLKHIGAKDVVVKLAYAIGVAEPVMVTVQADGKEVEINAGWDLTPNGIIRELGLKNPMFQKTAEWGHFGNNFPWDVI